MPFTFEYIQQVQEAIAELRPTASPHAGRKRSAAGHIGEEILAALLVYGYPVLGLTLMLGTRARLSHRRYRWWSPGH